MCIWLKHESHTPPENWLTPLPVSPRTPQSTRWLVTDQLWITAARSDSCHSRLQPGVCHSDDEGLTTLDLKESWVWCLSLCISSRKHLKSRSFTKSHYDEMTERLMDRNTVKLSVKLLGVVVVRTLWLQHFKIYIKFTGQNIFHFLK